MRLFACLQTRVAIDFPPNNQTVRAGSASVKHYQGTVNSLSKLNIDSSAPAVLYHSVHLKAVWIVSLDGAKTCAQKREKEYKGK